jgi:lipopolysaccharide exporter
MTATWSLRSSAVRGTAWNYATYILCKGAVVVTTVILARLLLPRDFGLMALGLLCINYLDWIRDLGVGPALIYRQEDPERTSDVAFALSMVFTSTLAVGGFFAAPVAAAFFDEPRAVGVIRALAVALFVSGLGAVHESRLRKHLDFRRRLTPELARALSKGTVAIALAVLGLGVWSLVWGQVASTVVATAIYWRISDWRPHLTWDPDIARHLIRYGLPMVGVSLGAMFLDNIDYLVIGRRMDAADLGFYTLGFRIPELVIISSCIVISQVLFPAYARLQDDHLALQAEYLAALRAVTLLTVPAGIGLALVAPEAVTVLYSQQWAATIPVTRLLAIYAVIYSLSFHAGDVFKAIGRPNILNLLTIVQLSFSVPVLWIAAGHTIVHVAGAMVGLITLLTVIRLTVAVKLLRIPVASLLEAVRPAILASIAMSVGVLTLGAVTPMAPPWRLATHVLIGALLYLAGLRVFDRDAFRAIANAARRLRSDPRVGRVGAANLGAQR